MAGRSYAPDRRVLQDRAETSPTSTSRSTKPVSSTRARSRTGAGTSSSERQGFPPPTARNQLPVITERGGREIGGHAFAIVGYTKRASSSRTRGEKMGPRRVRGVDVRRLAEERDGLLGRPVRRRRPPSTSVVSEAARCASPAAGRDWPSISEPTLAEHEISPYVIDMENEGRLSAKAGTSARILPTSLRWSDNYLKIASDEWAARSPESNRRGAVRTRRIEHRGGRCDRRTRVDPLSLIQNRFSPSS